MPLVEDAEDFPVSGPVDVSPTPDPVPSSTAPDAESEPAGTGVDEDENEALPEFDEKSRDDFIGLMYLGALTHAFPFAGHSFVIRTLTTDEILAVGQVVKDYEGSVSQMKAYATAVVAAAVVTVDKKPLPTPIRDLPGDTALRDRFDVVKKWYPYVIDVVYSEFLALEDRMNRVFAEMGKASG